MNTFKLQTLIVFILSVFSLIGCQQPGHIVTSSTNLSKAAATPQPNIDGKDPSGTPSGTTDTLPRNPGAGDAIAGQGGIDSCDEFLNQNLSPDLTAQNDMRVENVSGQTVVASAQNLDVNSVSGQLQINSAINATLQNISGQLNVRADQIVEASNISGSFCAQANSIKIISSSSGNARIYAKTIDSLTMQSGNLHIYGAVVKSVVGVSGNICLHDGAQILEMTNISSVVKTDCQ